MLYVGLSTHKLGIVEPKAEYGYQRIPLNENGKQKFPLSKSPWGIIRQIFIADTKDGYVGSESVFRPEHIKEFCVLSETAVCVNISCEEAKMINRFFHRDYICDKSDEEILEFMMG